MGAVYLAHDPDLKRDVAVKVMSGSSGDPKLRERFEREARAVAKLCHPNIVTVHDLGHDENGAPFIAMELLEGSDLQKLVEAGRLSFGDKLEMLVQVLGGLGHAHQNGIVHRDIKPANIFVLRDGTAKIMDFGVARWMQTQKTQSGLIVGTAGYISPEQLRGKPADGRSDIFSLGVVLFEILTQQALFPGDNIETIFFKTLGRKTPTLAAPNGRELPALQAVLERALAKEPEARFPTAEEMKKALQSVVANERALLTVTAPFVTREGGGLSRAQAANERKRSHASREDAAEGRRSSPAELHGGESRRPGGSRGGARPLHVRRLPAPHLLFHDRAPRRAGSGARAATRESRRRTGRTSFEPTDRSGCSSRARPAGREAEASPGTSAEERVRGEPHRARSSLGGG